MLPAQAPWKSNWIPAFLIFLSKVTIPSKELLEPGPITPYGAQYRFLRELDEGLNDAQRFFVVLKARQLGLSTIMLILDVFWLYIHPGIQGAIVADTDENRMQFRETITQMLENLPKGFRIRVKRHNRAALILENNSRLQYLVAGKGKNPDLGRSRGLNFLHATELAVWGDQNGINSLIDTLATEHPNRLYVFESTAKGYNVFHKVHQQAKTDPTKRAIFIGWWAKELYRIPAELTDPVSGEAMGPNPEFQRWWSANPVLDEQEEAMEALILADYGHQMTPEQWAWWRKQSYDRSETNLLQEFPWHEKVAFQVTGSPFFSAKRINEDMHFISNAGGAVSFSGYKYELGDDFLEMKCDEVFSGAEAELKVWEKPIKNAKYVIGVDVAYGRSEINDRHVIEVYRCFADKAVQVAEWATSVPETRHVAWVMAHLAGSYRDCMINLEVNGPGLQVMNEVKFLRREISVAHIRHTDAVFDPRAALDQARWFLYHRADVPGQGYLLNWKTNLDNKQEMFNGFRDAYNTEKVIIRSVELLGEMNSIVQDGVQIGASTGNKDDRPFASGLAIYAWRHWMQFPMMQDNRTYAIEMQRQREALESGRDVVAGIIPQFFTQKALERRENELQRLLES